MFQPEPVERDENGFWLHSVIAASGKEQIEDIPEAAGMEMEYVEFCSDAPPELQQMYDNGVSGENEDGPAPAVIAWEPSPPDGAGWLLLGLYDTDDGPTAAFGRLKTSATH